VRETAPIEKLKGAFSGTRNLFRSPWPSSRTGRNKIRVPLLVPTLVLARNCQVRLDDGVASENQASQPRKRRKKRLLLGLLVVAPCILLGFKWFLPSHPVFGAIREATAYDLNEAATIGWPYFYANTCLPG